MNTLENHLPSDQEPAPAWLRSFRAMARHLSVPALQALRLAVATDDKRLLQGATCQPPPLQCVASWPVEAACALGYAGWQGDSLHTVAEVEEYFARICAEVDLQLGEPAACRYFLNWYDETPRAEMRAQLLPALDALLAARGPTAIPSTSVDTSLDTQAFPVPATPLAKLLAKSIAALQAEKGGAA